MVEWIIHLMYFSLNVTLRISYHIWQYSNNTLKIYWLYRFIFIFASEHNISCQCKKNELHRAATNNNNNGAIKTRSVKALELSWEKFMRQYSGFISYWMSAATIFYIQMIDSLNVIFYMLPEEENPLVTRLQKLLNL